MYLKMIKRRTISVFGALALLFVLSACGSQKQEEAIEYQQISAEEAKRIMDSGEEYILLDVRSEEEFAEKHIPGAVLIPHTEIADRAEEELPDKEKKILVYCRSGNRSKIAAQVLADLGYTGVSEFGGINSWPYETE